MRRVLPLALLLLPGCNLLLPLGGGPPEGDRGRDVASGDHDLDVASVEQRPPDRKPDSASVDRDMVDGPLADAGPSGDAPTCPPLTGCTAVAGWNGMVVCGDSGPVGGGLTQNDAANLCKNMNNLALCTATQYLARGGQSVGFQNGNLAWLASCLWDGNNVVDPTLVNACGAVPNIGPFTISGCQGGSMSTSSLGVAASPDCWKLGPNATPGHWEPVDPSALLPAAVCCCRDI